MPDHTRQLRTIPQPILDARIALDILRAEGAEITPALEKTLPVYALNLSKTGQEVTIEGLVAAAREGEDFLKSPATIKPEVPVATYETVINGFHPYQDMTPVEQLIFACQKGDTEKVQTIIATHADTIKTIIYDEALRQAAKNGHNDLVLLLIGKGAEVTAGKDEALRWAAHNGHVDTVRLLIEKGANVTAENNEALRWAAANGHAGTVSLLIEKGADIQSCRDVALSAAAKSGSMDTVCLLLRYGCDIAACHDAIRDAATQGHTDIVRLLLERGANPNDENNNGESLLLITAEKGYTETCRLLIDKGAHINHMSRDKWSPLFLSLNNQHYDTAAMLLDLGAEHCVKTRALEPVYDLYKEQVQHWQQTVRLLPPKGLHQENPAYFKRSCFEAVVKMLAKEDCKGREANIMAFHAAGLFQSESRVLQYLAQWGAAGKQPLHDLIQMIKLPREGAPNLKDWGDAVLKCGPSMARLVKFGDKIQSPLPSSDGKTWSMVNTRAACARFSFNKAAEHPALAAVCFEHEVDEDDFNAALSLVQKTNPEEKTVPDIVIDGSKFGAEGARFYRLPANDIRGLFLGEMTDCCQSIGNTGGPCAEHGYTSKDSGFYVVENAKGRIVGQTWAWRGTQGEMCFDSLETLGDNVTPEQWRKILQETAQELTAKKDHDITALHVGMGGATPASDLCRHFTDFAIAAPKGYAGYRDSGGEQMRIWKRYI